MLDTSSCARPNPLWGADCSARHKVGVSVIVSDVGGSCQSVDVLGWIQKWLEVVEKSAGLTCFSRASYGSSGDREVPGDVLGAFPHRGCNAVRILGMCKD